MTASEAILTIVAVLSVLSAPIVLCFYKQQLDILDAIRPILLKQKSSLTMISPVEFMQLERTVRGDRRYLGKNGDVLNLMFPKRYWFCCLKVVVHVTALAALATVVWRVGSIDDADATSASFFGAVDQEVNVAILLLAVSWLVYLLTVLLAFNQKNALQRRIKELSAVLQN